jgi:DNA uptake protein ComE-like DNA-binding protein
MNRRMIALRLTWLTLLAICFAHVSVAKKKPPGHPINLNTVSLGELQLVPGIGPSTADKILEMRKSCGAFKNVDDLLG